MGRTVIELHQEYSGAYIANRSLWLYHGAFFDSTGTVLEATKA
jgi:hypothetical protein